MDIIGGPSLTHSQRIVGASFQDRTHIMDTETYKHPVAHIVK
jgi:hypothetical protein